MVHILGSANQTYFFQSMGIETHQVGLVTSQLGLWPTGSFWLDVTCLSTAPPCGCNLPVQLRIPEIGFTAKKIKFDMASVAVRLSFLSTVALLNFVFVFVTGTDFVRFVSFRAIYHNITGGSVVCQESVPWSVALRDSSVLKAVLVDLFLLAFFTAQHSLLAWAPVKQACQSVLGVLNRAMYCTTTALALQVLMRYWQPVSNAPCLWLVHTAPWDVWFPLICFTCHFLAWAIIFSILLIFDHAELLGIKQVYYECLGLGDPLTLKSARAQRLYSHLRHPVCLELAVVLWLHPAFPLDRLLLAGYLTSYLVLAHSLDTQDCAYLSVQLRSKMQVFSLPPSGSVEASGTPTNNNNNNNNNHKQD
ncbi:nurim [Engraulis encrasicolus]|uniref:nurim n=1 Tax=Engraulis encrasicolus TaxID=184585 RepID=UPI002FD57692